MQLVDFFRSRRGGELVGIVIVAIGISLAAALLTYHPRDSSAFYTSTETEIRNAIGYYGATLAWVFVSFFGFASLLFPAVLLVGGWNRFWGRDIEYFHTKLIGFVILALAVPPLFDLALGKVWLRGALIASGGYLGQEINRAISGNMNTSGAAIALVTALLIGLLLATRISLAARLPGHSSAVRGPRPRDVVAVGALLRAPPQGEDERRDRAQAPRERRFAAAAARAQCRRIRRRPMPARAARSCAKSTGAAASRSAKSPRPICARRRKRSRSRKRRSVRAVPGPPAQASYPAAED